MHSFTRWLSVRTKQKCYFCFPARCLAHQTKQRWVKELPELHHSQAFLRVPVSKYADSDPEHKADPELHFSHSGEWLCHKLLTEKSQPGIEPAALRLRLIAEQTSLRRRRLLSKLQTFTCSASVCALTDCCQHDLFLIAKSKWCDVHSGWNMNPYIRLVCFTW